MKGKTEKETYFIELEAFNDCLADGRIKKFEGKRLSKSEKGQWLRNEYKIIEDIS